VQSDDPLALTRRSVWRGRRAQERVIELRYFAGLSIEETARALHVSVGTIGRELRLSEAWLHRELSREST
jgi:DNA-directed RNA polymerase specialized sigma24 family protein